MAAAVGRCLRIAPRLALALRIQPVAARHGDAERAHDDEADLCRAFHGVVIEAALSRPAVTEARPTHSAEAISPAAIRLDSSGSGMRARKYTMTWTISAITLQTAQSMMLAEWAIALAT